MLTGASRPGRVRGAITASGVAVLLMAAGAGAAPPQVSLADPGLNYAVDVPEADVSGLTITANGVKACTLGGFGMSTRLGRNPNFVSVDEVLTATVSSTCPGITLFISILDQDQKPVNPGPNASAPNEGATTGRRISLSVRQTVNWFDPLGPNGLRPVSKVTFKAQARSNGQTLCQKLVATVIGGSEATTSVEPCP